MNLHNAEFIKSAASTNDIISDGLPKIVFAGKSNVGKSSVINKLLNRKQFARVSNKPGKTIHINYFLIDKCTYFVDLPGYGYAIAAASEYKRWSKLMEIFFSNHDNITLGIMITDSRHKPTSDDITMAQWFKTSGRPFLVLANKIDKVKKSAREGNIAIIRETLGLSDDNEVIKFSAVTGSGREELISIIEECLNIGLV